MDQVSVTKVASLAFLLVIMLLMALPPASEAAPTLMKNNNNGTATFRCKNGLTGEEESCRHIANDYLDMEFMMGSGISRMLPEQLASYPDYTDYDALNNKARAACGRGPGFPYGCSAPSRAGGNGPNKQPEPCDIYKRNNQCSRRS